MNNLLHYLSSDDVWNVRNKNNGIFIGRQFKLDNSNYTRDAIVSMRELINQTSNNIMTDLNAVKI
jgi:hypothetical protein